MPRLCLMAVHAHPDDESSKGAGTIARYHAEGVHTVLVSCTGGEAGDILNPAMDQPGIKENMGEVRRLELAAAVEIIGYDELVLLGYRDSGMPGTASNADPRSFAQAPLDEAVGRLVAAIRRTRPQVVVTYSNDHGGYPHPDHIRVNEISEIAFDAAGDAEQYPETGEPWQPLKLYYVTWSAVRSLATHAKFEELGLKSPFSEERLARLREAVATQPAGREACIDITGFGGVSREALRAHATQIDPTSSQWFGLPDEVADTVHPYDYYELARDLTGTEPVEAAGPDEDDLFAGIRTPVGS